jgi:hypothetical protein
MAEHLSMNTVVHAAVRRDLQRFTKALEEFPAGSSQRAADLDRAWQHLDHQLYHHHHSEETIFWPAARRAPTRPWSVTSAGSMTGWPRR